MKLRSTIAAIAVFAATTSWSQTAASSHSREVEAKSNAIGIAQNAQAQSVMRQRVEDMGNTLKKMHELLIQMQASAAKNATKDPVAKANLAMWGLMLSDLDKQYDQLRAASHARQDLEARRAAMYKQAEAKAAAQAALAKGQGGAQQPTADSAAQSATPAAPEPASTQPAPAATLTPASTSQSPN
jgi:hypothetical protein